MSEVTPGAVDDGKTLTVLSPTAEEPIEGLPPGFGEGIAGRIAFLIAVAFSTFQIYVAAYGSLPSQVVRAMHVGFLLLLGFVLDRQSARQNAGRENLVLVARRSLVS